ncbi:exonuclease domain-containing protein [Microbacterium sp. 22215]|uniref:exonuclease domain-containing protein n=1 Tax=Microbacterium sp. 22215 TaxID=3453893 RepID=UPI003F865595
MPTVATTTTSKTCPLSEGQTTVSAADARTGLNFTAIDFETANRSRESVCAVGAVRVQGGVIVGEFSSFVKPPSGFDEFEEINVRVHGITARDVDDAPTWDAVYPQLMAFVGEDLLVGHNARFDVSVLLNATGAYDLPWPELGTLCTLQLARAALHIPSYSLPWVATHLNMGAFDHHDPLADARTSAAVLIALARQVGAESVVALADHHAVPIVPTFIDDIDGLATELDSSPDPEVGGGFAGQMVCFTGALRMMVRDDARSLVAEHGGLTQPAPNKKTTILVTGDFDARTFRPGAAFSSKLQKAFDLVDAGQRLEIITESDFIARLSLGEEALRARARRRAKLPEWVVAHSGNGPTGDYWEWFRAALAHPKGRAVAGDACIWCDAPVGQSAHWIHRDRHVCGVHCNERLKRSAARAWSNAGIRQPAPTAPWDR